MRPEELAKTLDLAVAWDLGSDGDLDSVCAEAIERHLAAVSATSDQVADVRRRLLGSDVKTCAVIGLPDGSMSRADKLAALTEAVADGADELDIFMNMEALCGGGAREVRDEVVTLVRSARSRASMRGRGEVLVKILIAATRDERFTRLACHIVERAQADFAMVGEPTAAPRLRDVELLRECLPAAVGVGVVGVGQLAEAEEAIGAGATRVSSPVAGTIFDDYRARKVA